VKILITLLLSAVLLGHSPSRACSRVIFKNIEGDVYTGRCMDWFNETGTDLFVFPRGMKRDGGTSGNTLQWTSKYGSVISSFDNVATADGMNEKGLVANLLYLSDADFGLPGDKPTLNIAAWTQYVLDNYATVAEAVAVLEKDPFRIVAPVLKGGVPTTCHLSISDVTGDSAIFEFIEGKLVVHHGPEYKVMTNQPPFDQQLAINDYWKDVNGSDFLPGTSRPSDRFARASYYINAIAQGADKNYVSIVPGHTLKNQSIASLLSVMRDISVPLDLSSSASDPNNASTVWRTISDQKDLVYYYDSAASAWQSVRLASRAGVCGGRPVKKGDEDACVSGPPRGHGAFRGRPFRGGDECRVERCRTAAGVRLVKTPGGSTDRGFLCFAVGPDHGDRASSGRAA
jgi:penicillin V acylase-like amidase (Ntn superfamily)